MTPRQKGQFWRVERDAWKRFAPASGIRSGDAEEHDKWRHDQLALATDGAVTSSSQIHGGNYARIMAHFSAIAGDDAAVGHYSAEAENQNAKLIMAKLAQLTWMTGTEHSWDYARGIFVQMRLPDSVMDCPHELAVKVLMALDTQIRRICADAGCRPIDARRAHAAGALWMPLLSDRDSCPLWASAIAQNKDARRHRKYDHGNTPKRAPREALLQTP